MTSVTRSSRWVAIAVGPTSKLCLLTAFRAWQSIEITLVCEDCLRTEHPERCRHKLASMPRWLSSQKVEVVRKLLAEARTTILCQNVPLLTFCPRIVVRRTQLCY